MNDLRQKDLEVVFLQKRGKEEARVPLYFITFSVYLGFYLDRIIR